MELLFRRKQTSGKVKSVVFKLWSKIEFDDEEQEIVRRYQFDEAVLIEAIQPDLMRKTILASFGIFAVSFWIFLLSSDWEPGFSLAC